MPSFEGNLLNSGTKLPHKKLETQSRLSYGEDAESISPGLDSVPGRDRQTDGQTDGKNSHSK